MMPLREVLIRPGIIDSERVCALPLACQLFFRNLMHCCDGKARFPADAAELRAALYWRTPAVTSPHIEVWLQKCAQARLVKLYTRDGKKYGEVENYGQRDTARKAIYPPPPGQVEMTLDADPPPKKAKKKMNRIEGEGEYAPEGARPPAPVKFSMTETDEQWLARLTQAWPGINLAREIAQAQANRQRAGKKLERAWFEAHWLTKTSPAVNFASAAATPAAPISSEPEAWRAWLKDHHYNESWAETAAAYDWTTMPGNFRSKIERGMGDHRRTA
jgi:hypothetical protein